MKALLLPQVLLTYALFFSTTNSQLIPVLSNTKPTPDTNLRQQQRPIDPSRNFEPSQQLPEQPSKPSNNDQERATGNFILTDVLNTQPSIEIFAGFINDFDTIYSRLNDANQNTTILAPRNAAILSLKRKPWEDPRDYAALGANAYVGKEGEDRAHDNSRRFSEAHILTSSPWSEGEDGMMEAMDGRSLWWEKKDGRVVVQPDGVEVEGVVSRVANGEIWILKGVLDHEA